MKEKEILEFKKFSKENELTEEEIREAYNLYRELFGNFSLSFEEISDIISCPEAINVLIKENDHVIGFVSGLPLYKFDLIPEKLRPLVKFMMKKSFFILALGIKQKKETPSIRVLFKTYKELLERVKKAGYKNIYTLARATKEKQGTTMSRHLQKLAKAKKIWTIKDLAPGENFDFLRISNIDRLLKELSKRGY